MSGGHHAHIHWYGAGGTHRPDLALLQHAQQAHLKRSGGFADFVQKQGATVHALEQAWPVFIGPGKRPALVAKQFRLEQAVWNGRTVFGDKSALSAWTGVMDSASQQFFSGARFA